MDSLFINGFIYYTSPLYYTVRARASKYKYKPSFYISMLYYYILNTYSYY